MAEPGSGEAPPPPKETSTGHPPDLGGLQPEKFPLTPKWKIGEDDVSKGGAGGETPSQPAKTSEDSPANLGGLQPEIMPLSKKWQVGDNVPNESSDQPGKNVNGEAPNE